MNTQYHITKHAYEQFHRRFSIPSISKEKDISRMFYLLDNVCKPISHVSPNRRTETEKQYSIGHVPTRLVFMIQKELVNGKHNVITVFRSHQPFQYI